uniref:Multifunctional fusion protein n=1 Tax=Cyanidiococcus yangmingshanensis TaxID=2690220 RepID=A0A7G5VUR2_9RHOD|nr:elongation factor Ts [Cyanidiococcus yangmingshanensis]QMX77429.1 elongation factor Ts [Cyanidiococcus yangmingshanensis]UNJ16043.1 elongation factor Ts [Cyanidioschyzonaceae sp. 3]WDB00464.1 elongation factor Ts [Cyanidiococcus yangmingshanensis]
MKDLVQQLRKNTGAGVMDCKKALQEAQGDLSQAMNLLRKKGLAKAEQKRTRSTANGRIESYVHAGHRLGVLLELNCETDFVAKSEPFQQLAKNLAMQIAANEEVKYLKWEDIPLNVIESMKTHYEAEISNKPAHMQQEILDAKVKKHLLKQCLLEQPYIKDEQFTVDELIRTVIAQVGENIRLTRFVRFALGEQTHD